MLSLRMLVATDCVAASSSKCSSFHCMCCPTGEEHMASWLRIFLLPPSNRAMLYAGGVKASNVAALPDDEYVCGRHISSAWASSSVL
jgi:hypothetical protein